MATRSTHLSTWISLDLKSRFADAAAHRGLSESAFLKQLVENALPEIGDKLEPIQRSAPAARVARVTVRLLAEDRSLLGERATARGMPLASYISSLVRSHLRNLAPLPDRELEALRMVVTQLTAIGRNLNAIARAASAGSPAGGPTTEHVRLMLRIGEGLRVHVRELISANITSWEDGDASAPH